MFDFDELETVEHECAVRSKLSGHQECQAVQNGRDDGNHVEEVELVVCIGDIHGQLQKLKWLWANLEERLSSDVLQSACVIFLGDYCDRGDDTKGVLDWLIHIRALRPPGLTHFIAGNHDFAMAAYLGCLPMQIDELELESLRPSDVGEDIFHWPVPGGMHIQGRRWGGGRAFTSAPTFASYGVRFDYTRGTRDELLAAVPESHKQFLSGLPWLCEIDIAFPPRRLLAVHAGLDIETPACNQLGPLRERNFTSLALQPRELGKIESLSGRRRVQDIPRELQGQMLIVSGHHGFTRISDDDRIICDTCAGQDSRVLEAVLLPSKEIVGSGELFPGQMAEISGLKVMHELNGKLCTVDTYNERNSRWTVVLEGTSDRIVVKSTNLAPPTSTKQREV